jgi:hypothetical protein
MLDAKCHLRLAPCLLAFERGRPMIRLTALRVAQPARGRRDRRNPINKPSLQQPYNSSRLRGLQQNDGPIQPTCGYLTAMLLQ